MGKGMKDAEFHTTMNLVLLMYFPQIAIHLGDLQNLILFIGYHTWPARRPTCYSGVLDHSESLHLNSRLRKGHKDNLAFSSHWFLKHWKLKPYTSKLLFPVLCSYWWSQWVHFELEKWGMAFPVLPGVSPSASRDCFAGSAVDRITTLSALQAVSLFLGSCCTWAPSPAAPTHFASLTEA